jgi:hypothetical protein
VESITRTSAFVRLARLLLISFIAVASVPACIKPSVIRHEVPIPYHLPAQLPPGAERLPLKVGIYYSPEFENYEHFDRTFGESGVATPVGYFSIRQFKSMLFAMFQRSESVDRRPPYAAGGPASEFQLIIEPRIERFAANIETFSMGPLTARIDYRFKLYLPDGTTLATWNISASDTGEKSGWDSGVKFYEERTKALVQKSSNQFMQKFFDAPEVKTWLAEISEKNAGAAKLAKAPDSAFDVNASALASGAAVVVANMTLEGVDVSAKLYWQVGPTRIPVGNSSVKSRILAAHLTVKNNRAEPIVIDPSNLRLHTNQFATLTPDSARSVAQRMFRDGTYGDDGTTAAFFAGGIFGVLASMDQANVNDQMIKTTTDELRRAELDNQTIDPNQTASGIAYFIALGVDGKLDEPELRVSIFDPSQRKSYETTLNMTTGTATGGTLLLAGLKPPESVPEKIKVVEAPQQAEEAADTTTGPLRVGVLPPAFFAPTLPSSTFNEERIYSAIRVYVRNHDALDVVYDYATNQAEDVYDRSRLWSDSFVDKSPRETNVKAAAKTLGVDVAVMAWINTTWTGTKTDLYLVDVSGDRMHKTNGWASQADKLIARAFQPVINRHARRGGGAITATGGALLLAGSKPPESTIGTTEKAVATATVHTQSRRQLLNPTELRVLLTGNTFTGQTSKGIKFHVYYRADGAMFGILLSGRSKGKRDDGTWNVTDERGHCRQWIKWAGAAEDCFNLFRYSGSVIYEQNSGAEGRKGSGVMRTGNPENL